MERKREREGAEKDSAIEGLVVQRLARPFVWAVIYCWHNVKQPNHSGRLGERERGERERKSKGDYAANSEEEKMKERKVTSTGAAFFGMVKKRSLVRTVLNPPSINSMRTMASFPSGEGLTATMVPL